MNKTNPRIILDHSDLRISVQHDKNGKAVFTGTSKRYEPYEATASNVFDCFFRFNIQLAEQKNIATLLDKADHR